MCFICSLHGSVSYCAQSAILAQVLEGGTIGPTRPFGCYSILGKSEMGGMAGNEECKRCQRRKEVRCATFCIATFALGGHGRTTTRLAQRISRRLFLSRGCSVPFPSHALRCPPHPSRPATAAPRGGPPSWNENVRLTSCNDAGPSMRVHIDVHIECVSSPYSGTVVGDTPSVKVEWVWLIDGTVCGTGTIYSTAGTGYIWI